MPFLSSISKNTMDDEGRDATHLAVEDIAAFIDGALSPSVRARVEAHLANCDECRIEVIAVSRLLRERSPRRRLYLPAVVAAAAAALVLIAIGRQSPVGTVPVRVYREPVITTAIAPAVVAPRGAVTAAPRLVWTSVSRADLYRVTLFDDTGRSIWESQTRDTSAALPTGITLRERSSYYWRIEAQTDWNRWVASDLIEFSIASPGQ